MGFARPFGPEADLEQRAQRLRGLRHPDPLVRRLCWQLIERSPYDKAILRAAVEAFQDVDTEVRRYGAGALEDAGLKAEDAIADVVRLLGDSDWRMREIAEHTLENCGDKAIPALVDTFNDHSGATASKRRSSAIKVLGHLVATDDKRVHRLLKAAFTDKDPQVRTYLLIGLAGQREKARLYLREFVALMQDSDTEVASTAMSLLGNFGEAGAEAVPVLLKMLKNPSTRLYAIQDLSEVGRNDPAVLPALIDCWSPEADYWTCHLLAHVLVKFGRPNAKMIVPVLEKLSQDDRCGPGDARRTRIMAMYSLGQFGADATSAVPTLLKLAEESQESRVAIEALERIAPDNPKVIKLRKPLSLPALPLDDGR